MTESLCSSSFIIESNSNLLDSSAVLEMFLNGPLLGSEGKVTNEHGGNFVRSSSWGSTGWLAGEFNINGSSIELLLVGSIESSSSLGVLTIFNESLSLSVKELALGQGTEGLEHTSDGVLISVVGKTRDEELGLTSVFILNLSDTVTVGLGNIISSSRSLSRGLLGGLS